MGAWIILCGAVLAYCTLPGRAYQVKEPSSDRTVTVTTKPIHFGHVFDDVVTGSGNADAGHRQQLQEFRPSKKLFNNLIVRPEYLRTPSNNYDNIAEMNAIQQQLQLMAPDQLFKNLFVLPPQALTYNFDQTPQTETAEDENNASDDGDVAQISSEKADQGVSETIAYSKPIDYPQEAAASYHVEDHVKKKQKEVHYHQHKHLHEHDHKQEHVHKHQQEHQHDHRHGHKHDEANQHHHKANHDHHHKDEHWHSHKGEHHHEHDAKHHHDHKQEHKHEHWHDQKHAHHSDHKHEHGHKGEHHHEEHDEHKHEHKHGHDHYGKHKHDHRNEHKHSHHHKHDGHHQHSHHSKHDHHHRSRSHPYKIYIKKYHHH